MRPKCPLPRGKHHKEDFAAAGTHDIGSVARTPIPASPPGKKLTANPEFPSGAILSQLLNMKEPHSKVLLLKNVAATLWNKQEHPIFRLANCQLKQKPQTNQNKDMFRCVFTNQGINVGSMLHGCTDFIDFWLCHSTIQYLPIQKIILLSARTSDARTASTFWLWHRG